MTKVKTDKHMCQIGHCFQLNVIANWDYNNLLLFVPYQLFWWWQVNVKMIYSQNDWVNIAYPPIMVINTVNKKTVKWILK